MNSCIAAVSMIGLLCSAAFGGEYKYTGSNWLSIGMGMDPTHSDRRFVLCVDEKLLEKPKIDDAAPVKQSLTKSELVKYASDFYQALDLDMSLTASSVLASADARFKFSDQEALHEDSLSWVFTTEIDYGTESIHPLEFESHAKALLQDRVRFYERCGTEIVVSQRRKIRILAVFTAHNLTKSKKDSIELSFHGEEGGGGVGKVSFSSNFKQFVLDASSQSRVSATISTIGGKGIEQLISTVIVSEGDLQKLETAMSDYITGLGAGQNRLNAPAVEFSTIDVASLGCAEVRSKAGQRSCPYRSDERLLRLHR